jgi:hypothetical protein
MSIYENKGVVTMHVPGEEINKCSRMEKKTPFTVSEITSRVLQLPRITKFFHNFSPASLIFQDLKPPNLMLCEHGEKHMRQNCTVEVPVLHLSGKLQHWPGRFLSCCFLLFVVTCWLSPIIRHSLWKSQYSGCRHNLHTLGTALELYSSENRGRYPVSLELVSPRYIKDFPTCPASGKMSYIYEHCMVPDVYTLYCKGGYHGKERLAPGTAGHCPPGLRYQQDDGPFYYGPTCSVYEDEL